MAWVSKKVYAILMNTEEGKDIIEKLPDLTQEECDLELDKFFDGNGEYLKAKEEDEFEDMAYRNADTDYSKDLDEDKQEDLPNYLRDADYQEGHDYELDALRERDEQGLNNDGSQEEIRQEIIEDGKEDWVKTPEDEKVWNSLSDDEKYLLSMSSDMGFWFDEISGNEDAMEKYKTLASKFSGNKNK